MRIFLIHFITGLILFASVTSLTWGIGTIISAGYGVLAFYLLIGLPGAYGLFIYLTSYFNLTVSIIQYIVTGFLTFAANGEIEPMYHNIVANSNLGKPLEVIITTIIGVTITVVIKIISDFGLIAAKCKTREQNINKILSPTILQRKNGANQVN